MASASERLFIRDGIVADVRNDGRQRLDYRYFTLKTGHKHRTRTGRSNGMLCFRWDISCMCQRLIGE